MLKFNQKVKARIQVAGEHWLWIGRKANGYTPVLGDTYISRYCWEQVNGPIGAYKVVSNCAEKWCVNPAHKRLVAIPARSCK